METGEGSVMQTQSAYAFIERTFRISGDQGRPSLMVWAKGRVVQISMQYGSMEVSVCQVNKLEEVLSSCKIDYKKKNKRNIKERKKMSKKKNNNKKNVNMKPLVSKSMYVKQLQGYAQRNTC